MRTLTCLPLEILFHVHLYALSEFLPIITKHFYASFANATTSHKAEYIALRHEQPHTITRALLYPICTPRVLEALLKISNPSATHPPTLPKRFFHNLHARRPPEGWTSDTHPLPLLRVLYTTWRIPSPDANAHHALQHAVNAQFEDLVEFLLAHGADPRRSSGRPVSIAIMRKDLKMVRLLCERRDDPKESVKYVGKGKKRRLEDRIKPELDIGFLKLAVSCGARDIAQYFVDKGVVPDIATLKLLQGGSSV
ncbi:hypothetical protein EXIGLDRAFT_764116 [Exidia glandulosa HHB12029]|uniref:Ankyrin n=1 Tax=Exidia glandulosa HHB12029 TaxID=1314781 RepID=A0A165LEA7_EXIGL|nr:hypothetical protein EXIGLDRAFT_764116 [Exidia glandulosa HHB12029]